MRSKKGKFHDNYALILAATNLTGILVLGADFIKNYLNEFEY